LGFELVLDADVGGAAEPGCDRRHSARRTEAKVLMLNLIAGSRGDLGKATDKTPGQRATASHDADSANKPQTPPSDRKPCLAKKTGKRLNWRPRLPDNQGARICQIEKDAAELVANHLRGDSGKKWETGREVLDKVTTAWHNVRPRIRKQSSGRIAQMVRAQL
jgi:hypothetical protein